MIKSIKHLTVLLISGVSLSACNQDGQNSTTEVTINKSSNEEVFQTLHTFSEKSAKDNFSVKLTGARPNEMVLHFTISQPEGSVIYDVKIKGTDLLGSTDPNVDLRKEEDQIKFIRNIAKEFLGDEQFLDPAVTPEQVSDEYTPDKPFNEELRRSGLTGFTYRLGKENNIYIAWSEKEGKVKIYYNCC